MSIEAFESPERADFSVENQSFLFGEHLARYQFATHYVRDKRVVDVAAGTGYGSALLSQAGALHVVGIDYDRKTIDANLRLLRTHGIEFHQGDCETYDLSVHAPDVVVSFETIEHLKHPRPFLDRVRDALKPDGVFLVSCPNNEKLGCNPHHLQSWDAQAFREMLGDYFGEVLLLGQEPTPSFVMNRSFINYIDHQVGVLHSHPSSRLWTFIRRALGKKAPARPDWGAYWTSPHDWWFVPEIRDEAGTLLAICRQPKR